MNPIKLVAVFIVSLVLMACGSSDVLTGHFTDSPVGGLTYTTETQTGITDATGAFTYKAGETVRFSIGDFAIGEAAVATATMTPVNLLPGVVLPTSASDMRVLTIQTNRKPLNFAATSFSKLHNILTFLQALDQDKDASNGITITIGMAAILDGVTIDFAGSVYEFRDGVALKQVMAQAVSQGLVDTGFIKLPGQAMDHFYQAQSISHSLMKPSNILVDSDNDGIANYITTYTYDTNGNQLTYSADDNGNGTANSITTYTYDTNGNKLTYSDDTDGDGTANRIKTYTYNTNGNKLTSSTDTNDDGAANYIETYTYDSNGNKLTSSFDTDGDGTANYIITYTYDTNGNKLTASSDTNGDGTANSIGTYTNDTNGNLLTYSVDENGDGTATYIETYTYDTNGNQLTYSEDTNGDGTANSIGTYTKDTNGNLLTYSVDENGDGTANSIATYTNVAATFRNFFQQTVFWGMIAHSFGLLRRLFLSEV